MNSISRLIPFLLLTLTLPACGGKAEAAPPVSVSIADVYTAAVATLTSQAGAFSPTVPASATTTPTVWFSATPLTSTPTSQLVLSSYTTTYGCYNAAYVSDVTIPDGTYLAPGESFTKTWEFLNTGTCQWKSDFRLTFETGTGMEGLDTFIGEPVAVGETAALSVSLIAPETEGTYTGYWRLASDSGDAFGGSVFVMIVVSEDTATATPEYTATATPTEVPTETSTETCVPPTTTSAAQAEDIVETVSATPTTVPEHGSESDPE
jgi:hypothetical protein